MRISKAISVLLFLFLLPGVNPTCAQSVVDIQEVLNVFNQLDPDKDIVTEFDPSKEVKFPIGVVKEIGGKPYVAAITNSEFYSDRSMLDIYFQFFLPGTSSPLAFGARQVKFNASGLEQAGGVRLELLSDYTPINTGKYRVTFKSNGGTYAQFGCNGIERIHLKGEIEFETSFITAADGVSPLRTTFETDIVDANNILLSVTLNPFQINALKGFTFSAQQVTLDFSDYANPSVAFPDGYFAEGLPAELWRGFACQSVTVEFPKELSPSSKNLSISFDNLIIDDDGVTADIKASNVLGGSESKSQMGWPISVESFGVSLVRNSLVGAGFGGTLKVPMMGNEAFGYEAYIRYDQYNNRSYRLLIELPENKQVSFNPLSAKLTLHKNSIIEVTYSNGKFIPQAILNGKMEIGYKPIELGVGFEGLKLSLDDVDITRLYLLEGVDISTLAAFQLSINKLDARKVGRDIRIDVNATVGLSTGSSFAISGTGEVNITAGKNSNNSWGIRRVNVKEIGLGLNVAALQFSGKVSIRQDDPMYGDGFGGEVDCSIAGVINGIKLGITFGKKEGFSYWYCGGEVSLTLPVAPSVIITKFNGALFYHMKENGSSNGQLVMSNFIPDKASGIGINSGVGLTVAAVAKGDVMVKLLFTNSGGVSYFGFDGLVYLLGAGPGSKSFKFYSNFTMGYDFGKKEFMSNTEVYVNVSDLIKGSGPNDRAGYIDILANPSTWYLKIGTPSDRVGLKAFGLLQAGCYFVAGDINDTFTLPEKCRSLIGNYKAPNLSQLKGGKSFGFGANLELSAGGRCGPFYADLALGGGFDLLLRDIDCVCKGSNDTPGIGGWYALGQAYFYLDGKVGIRFRSRSFDILSVGLAALLQAELPNPTWIKGTLAGRYKILGGLIRGKFNYSFEIGDRCELVRATSELADIKVIGDVTPKEGSKDIDVFASPQVAFNAALDKEFKLEGEGTSNKSYRVQLVDFTVKVNGKAVPGENVWNRDGDVLVYNTPDILPQNSDVNVFVKIKWQFKNKNGEWEDSSFEGKPDVEEKTLVFTTGPAPDFIPERNVEYSYPIENQANFYRDEHNRGYIKMIKGGFDYLFAKVDKGISWNLVARFASESGAINVPFEYSAANNSVGFIIPAQLKTAEKYELSLLRVPEVIRSTDRNITSQTGEVYNNAADTVEVTTKQADGNITIDEEKELYTITFRSSSYTNLAEKVKKFDSMSSNAPINNLPYTNLTLNGRIDEGFDEFEFGESKLVSIAALTDNNLWFNTFMKDAIYDSCNMAEGQGKRTPPVYTITPWQQYQPTMGEVRPTLITLNYNFPEAVYRDYSNLRSWYFEQKVNGKAIGSTCNAFKELLNRSSFPDIGFNTYGIRFYYKLPGRSEFNSSADTKVTY